MSELVSCPHCGKSLRVPDHLIGRTVRCPSCDTAFAARAAQEAPAAPEEEPPQQPRRRRRDDEEGFAERPRHLRGAREDDEEEEHARTRRSRDEDDEEDYEDDQRRRRGRGRRAAVAAVAAPAIALLVVGILGILMGIGNIVSTSAGFGIAPRMRNDPAHMTGRYIGASISLIWGIVVTLGGIKMKSLQSRGSAMTAAILAMIPCNPCCLVGLPIGIWALVALNKPEVKKAFS